MPESKLLPLDQVRTKLGAVWLGGAGSIILVLVIQSLLGRYEDKVQDVWGWVLPTIMPTLGMIVTVLGYTALDRNMSTAIVRKDFFQLSFWLSLFYLSLILLTVLVQPLVGATVEKAIQLMRQSNLWLGPFQGLVASSLGVLFVSRRKAGS
jgi:hypothetical protein